MAVEIKEVIIRAVINGDKEPAADEKRTTTSENTQALIQTCVNEVLRILKQSKQR